MTKVKRADKLWNVAAKRSRGRQDFAAAVAVAAKRGHAVGSNVVLGPDVLWSGGIGGPPHRYHAASPDPAVERTMASVTVDEVQARSEKRPWYRVLYIQVLIAIALGVIVGWLFPDF